MADPEAYDFLVLGSGKAGKYLAWSQAKLGKRSAVIERAYVGGSCPNIACLPSKNVIHSAKVADYFRRGREFGLNAEGYRLDMKGVRARKRTMVENSLAVHLKLFEESGTELIMGHGKFVAPRTIEVVNANAPTRVLQGERVIVSTGSRATIPELPGLSDAQPLTHVSALELKQVPERLIVLGGGYVGLELAQALRRFGSKVCIVERNERVAHLEDPDVSEAIEQLLRDEGIELYLGTEPQLVTGLSGERVRVQAKHLDMPVEIRGSHLLVAAGRTPNTSGIGLDKAGVAVDRRGYVQVNDRLETTAESTWAVGDCAGSPHFTHIAYDDYRVVRDNLAGKQRSTRDRLVPSCTFIDPEFARVGLSETEAKARGIDYRLAKIPIAEVLRTQTLSETRGFMKALIDPDSDRVLGFAAFGVNAGEVMSAVQLAMLAGLPARALGDAILTHPTMTEGLTVLFDSA